MTRIAIVGAGNMGGIHARSCEKIEGTTVTWVVDADIRRAEELATRLGARATIDEAEALGATDVDAAIIAVPTPLHQPMVECAARHGKHVFCEKPSARTVDEARAMIEACDRAGVRLMIGHVVRFFPDYVRIGALLRDGAIGQVAIARAARLNAHPGRHRPWYGQIDVSGGVIVDMMIHDFDTLRWYFGEVKRVFARGLTLSPRQPMTDYALAILRFESGVIAHVEASWAHTSFRTMIEIAGEHGLLRHASDESTALRLERTAAADGAPVPPVTASPLAEGPYETEIRHFLARLADGEPFLITGEDALRSLEVSLATLESVRTGQPVEFANGHPVSLESAR